MHSWQPINLSKCAVFCLTGILGITLFGFTVWPTASLAADPVVSTAEADICGEKGAGESNMDEFVTSPETRYTLEQPFGGVASVKDMAEYLQLAYTFALGIVGMLGVVLIMFGGLRWLGAAGNEQAIGEAKEIITSAVTGIIIALLSYSILIFINPQTLKTGVAILKIPVHLSCPYPAPTGTMASVEPYLDGRGVPTCSSYSAALVAVANNIPNITECAGGGCKIIVGNSYRTADSQEPLYACYQEKLATGTCPAGCGVCNQAAKPCCSNHQKGLAADLQLEYTGTDATIAKYGSSSGKSLNFVQTDNLADTSPAGKNQTLLKKIMIAQGTFTRFDGSSFPSTGEWWHFDADTKKITSCLAATLCRDSKTFPGYSAGAYCKSATSPVLYTLAACSSDPAGGATAVCVGNIEGGPSTQQLYDDAPWYLIEGCNNDTQEFRFDETSKDPSRSYYAYLSVPICS